MVIKNDGTLWSWNTGDFGKLGSSQAGEGEREGAACRGEFIRILYQVSQVSAGDCVGYAVRNDGTLLSWGTNGTGELGYFGSDGWDLIDPPCPDG